MSASQELEEPPSPLVTIEEECDTTTKSTYIVEKFLAVGNGKQRHCRQRSKVFSKSTSHSILKRHVYNNHLKGQVSFRTMLRPLQGPSTLTFEDLLVQFVGKGLHPFSIVEENGFIELLKSLNPEIKIPSRPTLVSWMKKRQLQLKSEKIRALQDVSSKVAITTDIWTALNRKPFMVVTGHYIDNEYSIQSTMLEFQYIPYLHGGSQIARLLEGVLDTYSLLESINGICSDNASNNEKAMDELKLRGHLKGAQNDMHIRCLAHVINLIVHDALKGDKGQIDLIRCLMHFSKPLVDVQTRWNSTYDMLTRAIKLRPVIDEFAKTNKEYSKYLIMEVASLFKRRRIDVVDEIASDMAIPLEEASINPITWWSLHIETLPILSKMA